MIPPILRDLCTAIGALVLILNAGLMVWWATRCAVIAWGDWRESRRKISGPARPLGEVRPVSDPTHPALVPGGAALGTARPHLRAVPSRRCEGGAA